MKASHKSSPRGSRSPLTTAAVPRPSRAARKLLAAVKPCLESLENRTLLSNTVWVNDNWVVTNDVVPFGLSSGDTVDDSNDELVPSIAGKTYGTDAFTSVTQAMAAGRSSGDVINVVTGIYTDTPTINQSVAVLGPQTGVDARTRSGVPEATFQGIGGAFNITAGGVTIDGLTLTNQSGGQDAAIVASGASATISNNIISGNISGLSIAGSNALVSRNYFVANNLSGAHRAQATNINSGSIGTIVSDNPILNHAFSIFATAPGGVVVQGAGTNAIIRDNVIAKGKVGVRLLDGGSATLRGNDFNAAGAQPSNTTDLLLESTAGAGTAAGSSVSGTSNSFTASGSYIENRSPNAVDAIHNLFGGQNPASISLPSLFTLEDKIIHSVDIAGAGLVRVKANQVFVTPLSYVTPATTPSIQRGVDSASSGDTVNVQSATYDNTVSINESLTLLGDSAPTITRTSGADQTLITVTAPSVTIQGFTLLVDKPYATAGIYAPGTGGFNGIQILNNTITSEGTGGFFTPISSSSSRSAGIALLSTSPTGDSAIIRGNTINGADSLVSRGIWLSQVAATIGGSVGSDGNDITAGIQDVLLSFPSWNQTTLRKNYFRGAGVDVTEPNSTSTGIDIQGNFFVPVGAFSQALLIKHDYQGVPVNVSENQFTTRTVGIYDGGSSNVSIADNTFNVVAGVTSFRHIVVDTAWPGTIVAPYQSNSVSITGNTLNDAGVAGGTGIEFRNGNKGLAAPDFSAITLGGAGAAANIFKGGLASYLRLDPTVAKEFSTDLDGSQNTYAVSGGEKRPAAMGLAERFELEDKVFHKVDAGATGFVSMVSGHIFVTPATTPTATDNDYTRLANAIAASSDGYTIELSGTFNWTETNAAASWAKGNDNVATTADDHSLLVSAGLDNVTFTAPGGLGTAHIVGPGDLVNAPPGGFLVFRGGPNLGWTISNLSIENFELGIGYFNGAGGVNAFDNTTITGNRIEVATDLSPTADSNDNVEPGNDSNIGIHYSFGDDQTISNNTIVFPGTGISDSAHGVWAASTGILSNTSGGAYQNLQITGNVMHVTGAQSADPEVIRGIWENGYGHTKNIAVSNNQFLDDSPTNDPMANLQRAFTVTSHSSATSTVTYANNTVDGANIGWQWYSPASFSGTQPAVLSGNTLTNVKTGLLVRSSGSARVAGNSFTNSGAMAGQGIAVQVMGGSSAIIDGTASENQISGFATGIQSSGTLTVSGNDTSIHGNAIGIDVSGGSATVSGNHIYDSSTAGIRLSSGGTASITGNDFSGATANAADILLASDAGAISGPLSGNTFAASGFFIDNQSAGNITAAKSANTYPISNNFRIEDKIHHKLDTDLPATTGLVRYVANNVYVTDAGTDHSIQRGIDAAFVGNTVNVEAGGYAENLLVNKKLTVLGAGSDTDTATNTVVTSAAQNLDVIRVTGSGISSADPLLIQDVRVTGANSSTATIYAGIALDAGGANTVSHVKLDNVAAVGNGNANTNRGSGVLLRGANKATDFINDLSIVNSVLSDNRGYGLYSKNASIDGLTVTGSGAGRTTISNHRHSGIVMDGSGTLASQYKNFTITHVDFAGNDSIGDTDQGHGELVLNGYNGNLTVDDVTFTSGAIVANPSASATIDGALVIQGIYSPATAPSGHIAISNVSFQDLASATVFPRAAVGIWNFADADAGISVDQAQFASTGKTRGGLYLYNVKGTTPLSVSNATFNGNYRYVNGAVNQADDIVLYMNNANVTATNNVTFTGAANGFDIEDRVYHAMDWATLPGYQGKVVFDAGDVYVTPLTRGVQRGVDVADAGDTVHVATGTYTEQVNIGKNLTVIGSGDSTIIKSPASLAMLNGYQPIVQVQGATATLKNFKIDGGGLGNANTSIAGLLYFNAGGLVDNLTITAVRDNPYSGAQHGNAFVASNQDAAPRSLTVSNNIINDYQKNGITAKGAGLTATVTGNTVTGQGDTPRIGQNGIQLSSGATGTISNNIVSGHEYSGTNPGNVGGPDWLTQIQSTGIMVSGASGTIGVSGNTLDGNDIGIAVLGNATLSGNTLGATAANRYYGVLVEDGTATLTGDAITGGNVGVAAYSLNGDAGDTAVTVSGGSVANSGTGVLVFRESGAAHTAKASIDGANLAGSGAAGTGVDVDGGVAKIANSALTGRHIGIWAHNDANVDAGSDSTDGNPTSLGASTGNNILTGYTGFGGNFAVRDDNTVASANRNVLARHNDFGPAVTPSVIEGKLYDDTDNALNTKVLFDPALNQLSTIPTIVYVDDSWDGTVLGADPDATGPATAFGYDAFAVIQDGVNAVTADGTGTVHVYDGTYAESNIAIDKDITIEGESQSGVTITPAFADSHTDSTFGGTVSNGLLVQHDGVTITHLTLDGGASRNFRAGIITDSRLNTAIDNLTVQYVTVQNANRRGIQIYGGSTSTKSSGHVIDHNTVDGVSSGPGIALFDAAATVTWNDVSNTPSAIESVEVVTTGGSTVHIENNTLHPTTTDPQGATAIQLVVPGVGTTITSNHITLSGGQNDIGMVVRNATGAVTVDQNDITGTAGDAGIWMFGNSVAVNVTANTFTATGSTSTTAGEGAGIFMSDDGAIFTNGDDDPVPALPTSATITGNTISGFATGVHLYRTSGQTVQADITGNTGSIHGNATGIEINGGSATITGNGIYGNATGIRVKGGGTATISSNDFDGTADNATDLEISSTAGIVTIGSDNAFAGESYFINNGTSQSYDLSANGTTFDQADNFRIEDRMFHKLDDATKGLITWNAGKVYVTDAGTDHSLQRGIDAASTGATVNVEAGSYVENVNLNKRLTLLGAGSVTTGTIISPASGNAITIAASGTDSSHRLVVQDLRVTAPGNGIHIDSAVSYLKLDNVAAVGNTYGVEIHNSAAIDDIVINNPTLSGNSVGLRSATSGAVDGLTMTGGTISSNDQGITINANSGSTSNQNSFTNISITGTSVAGNTAKGMYFEKLDHASLSGLTVSGNGTGPTAPAGIDINLKYGVYSALALSSLTLVDNGTGNSGSGTGLAIKGRDDGSYASKPASLSGVSLSGVSISGSPTDLSFGNNVTGITLSSVDLQGSGAGLMVYTMPVQSLSLGNTSFAGTLSSYLANATANPMDATGASFDGVAASAASTDQQFAIADKVLDAVDVGTLGLVRTKAANIYVTSNSFYAPLGTTTPSIQRGIDQADSGDTVNVRAGTYVGRLNLGKTLTLLGAQVGVDARTRSGAESIITEAGLSTPNPDLLVEISASAGGSLVDGFTLNADQTNATADTSAVRIWASNVTVANNKIDGFAGVIFKGGSNLTVDQNTFTVNKVGFVAQPGASTNVNITNNAFGVGTSLQNDPSAINLTGVTGGSVVGNVAIGFVSGTTGRALAGSSLSGTSGSPFTISGNSFTGNRDAISIFTNSTFIDISDNDFSNNARYGIAVKGQDINIDANTLNNNSTAGINIEKHTLTTERVTVTRNTIIGNGTGLIVTNAGAVSEVSENFIDNNGTGVRIDATASTVGPIRSNHVGGNSVSGLTNNSTAAVDATSNWWGTDDGPDTLANTWGGLPKGDAIIGDALFAPWLASGTDTAPVTPGFQPGSIDSTPPAIGDPDLDVSSDTGASAIDNITNDNTPTFSGTVEAGATVLLMEGTNVLGSTTATGSGSWSITSSSLGDGSHTVFARATDGSGNSADSGALAVTIDTIAPAVDAGSDVIRNEGQSTTLSGTDSDTGGSGVDTTVWALLSSTNPNQPTVAGSSLSTLTFTPNDDGTYQFQYAVTDVAGNQASDTVIVTSQNVAPAVEPIAGAPLSSAEGTEITVTGSASDAAGANDPLTYSWNVAKNGTPGFATGSAVNLSSFNFTPDDDGSYVVTMTVTDGDGGSTAVSSSAIGVTSVDPTAGLSAAGDINENGSGTYTWSLNSPLDPSTADTTAGFHYAFDLNGNGIFGDAFDLANGGGSGSYGGSSATSSFTASPAIIAAIANGDLAGTTTFAVGARILDKDGGHSDYSRTVTVHDVAPTLSLSGAASIDESGVSNYTLILSNLTDPGQGDLALTDLVQINWGYNSQTTLLSSAQIAQLVGGSPVTLNFTYPDGTGATLPVTADINQNSKGYYSGHLTPTAYNATSVLVNNLVPTGTLSNNGPVDAGSSATVIWSSHSDPSPVDNASLRYSYDFGSDGTWDVGSGTYASSAGTSFIATVPGSFLSGSSLVVKARIMDKDGGVTERTTTIGVNPVSFRVASLSSTPSGFDVTFNRDYLQSVVNLYGTSPDVLVTLGGNPVKGSLIFTGPNTLSWVKTGGALAAGTYAVTLKSGSSTAFVDNDASPGDQLDGNSDGSAGDDYSTSFVASAPGRVLSIRDFARGPGQPIDIPAFGAGVPISLSDGNGIVSVLFTLRYDPAALQLDATPITAGPDLPAGWLIDYNTATSGEIQVSVYQSTGAALTSGPKSLLVLHAAVQSGAVYGSRERLHFVADDGNAANGVEFEIANDSGAVAAVGDDAVHSVMFVGDVNANGAYSAFDAAQISRAAVGLPDSFGIFHSNTDSVIVGDVNNDGALTSFDASQVAREAVGIDVVWIPNNPPPVVGSAPAVGLAPQLGGAASLKLPSNIVATAGGTINVPVGIQTSHGPDVPPAISFEIKYDPAVLSIDAATGARSTALAQSLGLTVVANVVAPGRMLVVVYGGVSMGTVSSDLVTLSFRVTASASTLKSTQIRVSGTDESVGQSLAERTAQVVFGRSPIRVPIRIDSGSSIADSIFSEVPIQ